MQIQDFIKKYDGQKVEYHSFNNNSLYQCVDLANKWITEGLGLSPIIGTNAQDFPSKATEFTYILNTPDGVPSAGDLVIFKSADGVGHISIFVSGTASLFTSFDQNYPSGSPCHIVSHNYRNVLGWLRPKNMTTDEMVISKKVFEELVTKATKFDALSAVGINQPQDVEVLRNIAKEERTLRDRAELEAKTAREELQYFRSEIASKLNTPQDLGRILGGIEEIVSTMDAQTTKLKVADDRIGEYERQVISMKAEINLLKLQLSSNKSLSTSSMLEMLMELFNRIKVILSKS